MPKRRLFTIICGSIGLAFGTLGALVLFAQCAEWWSFGDWNAVSLGYVFEYFKIPPSSSGSIGHIFLDLPASAALLGTGILIAVLGGRICRKAPG
jgi:hypothetical protein